MGKYLFAELVLTRGPDILQRRLSLQIPIDGTPITVGRALENDVVLDVNLLFASQRHCQLFVRPLSTKSLLSLSAVAEEEKEEKDNNLPLEKVNFHRGLKRPRESHSDQNQEENEKEMKETLQYKEKETNLELCLIDVGSSNGTFVNNIRVAVGIPTPLHHGDIIVLGGMRDILTGEKIPEDVINEKVPEIITWCIALQSQDSPSIINNNNNNNNNYLFEYEATPPVFPCAEFVEAEERRLTLTLLRSAQYKRESLETETEAKKIEEKDNHHIVLSPPAKTQPSPPPTVLKRWNETQMQEINNEEKMECGNSPQTQAVRKLLHQDDKENDTTTTTNNNNNDNENNKSNDNGTSHLIMDTVTNCRSLNDTSTQPSGTDANYTSLKEEITEIFLNLDFPLIRAVRVGMWSFHLPVNTTPSRGAKSKKTNNNKKNKLRQLTFTQTHLQWPMEIVGTATSRRKQQCDVDCNIAWSDVTQILFCTSCESLTVRLMPDAILSKPLEELCMSGTEGNFFITWLLDIENKSENNKNKNNNKKRGASKSAFMQFIHNMEEFCAVHKKPIPQPVNEAEFLAYYAPAP